MIWSRREVMGTGVLLGGLGCASTAWPQTPEPLATIAQGRVRGLRERGVCAFRGLPYGGSVSGTEHRFRAPPPPPSWTGVRDATRYGAPAMQPAGGPPGDEPAPAEDCLFLNVWTPAPDAAKRPVMVYFHGGGFTIGSGARPAQNGANLAREHDVVVVESNHRLGIFGYLYLGELLGPEYGGNQGLLDLVATLRWVRENIAAFGGDPANVTIFGESGGGGKVTCLYGMPSAAPLFARASIESPIGPTGRTPAQATEVARAAMRHLGLTDPRRLLDVPAEQLLRFQTGEGIAAPGARAAGGRADHRDQSFWPVVDGRILPELPFAGAAPAISAAKPLIVGGCRDEAVFFHLGDASAFALDEAGLRTRLAATLGDRAGAWIDAFRRSRPQASPSELYMAIGTATPWRAHAVHIAEEKARQHRAPVYAYILDYRSPVPVPGTGYPLGAPHAFDIPIKFDNVLADGPPEAIRRNPFTADQSAARRQAARNMSAMWAGFARTGVPAAPGQPAWRPYTIGTRETMLIDARCRLVADPEGAERRFWQGEPNPEAIR